MCVNATFSCCSILACAGLRPSTPCLPASLPPPISPLVMMSNSCPLYSEFSLGSSIIRLLADFPPPAPPPGFPPPSPHWRYGCHVRPSVSHFPQHHSAVRGVSPGIERPPGIEGPSAARFSLPTPPFSPSNRSPRPYFRHLVSPPSGCYPILIALTCPTPPHSGLRYPIPDPYFPLSGCIPLPGAGFWCPYWGLSYTPLVRPLSSWSPSPPDICLSPVSLTVYMQSSLPGIGAF